MPDGSSFPRTIAAPGPGVWQLDVTHFARPLTRFVQDWYPAAFEEGQARSMSRYGAPLETFRMQLVEGFPYVQPVPLGGPAQGAPPPRWLFALLARVLPAFRRCRRVAQEAFSTKLWRDDARRWSEEVWPGFEARLIALQEEPLTELDDDALLEHLERAVSLQIESIQAHFDTNPATMIPSGRLILKIRQWVGGDPAELLGVLRGVSPVLEAERVMLDEIRARLRPRDLQGTASEVLERLRRRDDALGEATQAWLQRVEHRQVWAGDAYFPTNAELPHLLVEQLRTPPRDEPDTEDAVKALRARVPAEHRAELDELLDEVRATVYLRDERSALNDAWTGGVVRRALLEVGRRLCSRGLVSTPSDVIHLTRDECVCMLRTGDGPDIDTIVAWARAHNRSSDEMPTFLGGDRPPDPPFDAIPGPLGELLVGVFAYVDLMEGDLGGVTTDELCGTPASPGEYIGIARLVNGPSDFDRVMPGDVLVARATMPSYNGALAIAGAVVTDRGGALSHAAIVARELGIPAVVSTKVATRRIPDGARVRVDGSTGEIEVMR